MFVNSDLLRLLFMMDKLGRQNCLKDEVFYRNDFYIVDFGSEKI